MYNRPVSFAPTTPGHTVDDWAGATTGQELAGFMLSGFLLALLGAILPAWGYHRDPPEFVTVGNFFLCLAGGIAASAALARPLLARRGLSFLLTFASGLACAALLFLAAVSPPASPWWRGLGLFALGSGAGLLNLGLFHTISRSYRADSAGALTKGGVWYGAGCLAATLLVAGTFYAYSVSTILALMALAPGAGAFIFARQSYARTDRVGDPPIRQTLGSFRSAGAALFALLLFFQFGNEWAIAGWLPLFLQRRVGLTPPMALMTLALYWLYLTAGRMGAVAALPRMRHGRLLAGSVASALFGCLILYSTNTAFGAISGVFFVAAGYASIFPLVAEAIGRRFPRYQPGFFNGIFSFALLGGLLAPATIGYAAAAWGVGVAIGIPLLGSCVVLALVLAIWLESKVSGR